MWLTGLESGSSIPTGCIIVFMRRMSGFPSSMFFTDASMSVVLINLHKPLSLDRSCSANFAKWFTDGGNRVVPATWKYGAPLKTLAIG